MTVKREQQAERMRRRGYVPVAEAAKRAGVTTSAVYQWLDGGAVKGARVGPARYVNVASLDDYLGPLA